MSTLNDRSEARREEPAYVFVAETLRAEIRAGEYTPGSRLPSMVELERRFRVSDAVIRNAMRLLKTEGLVESHRGGGTVVRSRPVARRIAMDRYRVAAADVALRRQRSAPSTMFTRDQGITWKQYRLDKQYTRVQADGDLASLLQVPVGSELLRRRFVFFAHGAATQISVNYLLWSMVEGTAVSDPDREPWPGGSIDQCAFLGHPVTRVEEAVKARMPTWEEARTLSMAEGVPVVAITRRLLSHSIVMEVCRDIVIPADRIELDYSIDL